MPEGGNHCNSLLHLWILLCINLCCQVGFVPSAKESIKCIFVVDASKGVFMTLDIGRRGRTCRIMVNSRIGCNLVALLHGEQAGGGKMGGRLC
jgi:hypothetical protein